MSCETILFHAALFVPSYLHFSNRAQRSYLWWQAKRKFYSRSHDSPLFAVESSMNLTYHSTLQWTICVYLKPFISRFSHATLHRTICVWLKPFVNVWVNSYFTKSIMHQSIPAASQMQSRRSQRRKCKRRSSWWSTIRDDRKQQQQTLLIEQTFMYSLNKSSAGYLPKRHPKLTRSPGVSVYMM